MKFRIKSRELRDTQLSRWHEVFAWIPRRISDTEMAWLCHVSRRMILGNTVHGRLRRAFQYGPLANILTQPIAGLFGDGMTQSAAQAVKPGPITIIGAGGGGGGAGNWGAGGNGGTGSSPQP